MYSINTQQETNVCTKYYALYYIDHHALYSVYPVAALHTFPLRDLVVAGYIKMPPYFRVLCMSATMEPTYRAPRGALPSYSEERSSHHMNYINWIYRQSIMGRLHTTCFMNCHIYCKEQSPNTSERSHTEKVNGAYRHVGTASSTSVDIAILKLRLQCQVNAIETMGNYADIIRLLIML